MSRAAQRMRVSDAPSPDSASGEVAERSASRSQTLRAPTGVDRRKESHARIVAQAARMIRERGIDGSSVDDLMGAAGLTRGGFYAHFSGKTALMVEALDLVFETAKRRWVAGLGRGTPALRPARAEESPEEWRRRALAMYLSEAHRDDPGDGCGVPALAAEIGRGPAELRRATEPHVRDLIALIAGKLGDAEAKRDEAIALFSACVGALALARAVEDRALANEILEATARRLAEG